MQINPNDRPSPPPPLAPRATTSLPTTQMAPKSDPIAPSAASSNIRPPSSAAIAKALLDGLVNLARRTWPGSPSTNLGRVEAVDPAASLRAIPSDVAGQETRVEKEANGTDGKQVAAQMSAAIGARAAAAYRPENPTPTIDTKK